MVYGQNAVDMTNNSNNNNNNSMTHGEHGRLCLTAYVSNSIKYIPKLYMFIILMYTHVTLPETP